MIAILGVLALPPLAGGQIDCVSPVLKLPAECGVITDMSGEPIPNATVTVGFADVGTSTTSDVRGRWGFLANTKESGWLRVEARGFRKERFEYVTRGKSIQACKKPVYIRLVVGEGCPVVTLNPKQGIRKY
jgi:hypothetical protein